MSSAIVRIIIIIEFLLVFYHVNRNDINLNNHFQHQTLKIKITQLNFIKEKNCFEFTNQKIF